MGFHLFAVLVCVLSVVGVVGIVAAHEGRLGRTGQTGLLLTLLGSAAAGAVVSVEALAFPAVADTAPQLLDLNGPLFNWPFIGMGIIALCWLVGIGVMGVSAARAAMFPRGEGVLLAVGALGFIVLAGPFVQVANVSAGIVFGAAQMWWACLLWSPNRGHLNDRVGMIWEAGGNPPSPCASTPAPHGDRYSAYVLGKGAESHPHSITVRSCWGDRPSYKRDRRAHDI